MALPNVGPSLDLTASDGTGLLLVSLSARVVVEDPLAFTELTLVFRNPLARQLEGRFRIGLPSGAAVSRFAMRVHGAWQEGEVVERQAARRAYEDFLHRRQDPALLEHEAGNEFSARVFPIEAHEEKHIVLSYSHELVKEGESYRLPLRGLPRIAALDIRALVGQAGAPTAAATSLGGTAQSWSVVEVQKRDWTPDVDFEVTPPASARAGLRSGNLVVARVSPPIEAAPDEIGSLLVLVDTSASRALGLDRQAHLVEGLAGALAEGGGASVPVVVACFDQEVQVLFEGDAKGAAASGIPARLAQRMALGASDLAGALRWAASRKGPALRRALLVTDGVATAGDVGPEALVAAAKGLSEGGVERLDVLAIGALRDDDTLRRLATAGLARDGVVCDGDTALPEIAARLTKATRSGIQVEVPGATWVWPARLDGVQRGDSVLVYADLPEGQAFGVRLDGVRYAPAAPSLGSAPRPLLERAWVKARIQRMEDMLARPGVDRDVRGGLEKQIVELSVKHRVLCSKTALLVLETDSDYDLYRIDRNALADILTVGLSGIEVMHRTAGSLRRSQAPEALATGEEDDAVTRTVTGAPEAPMAELADEGASDHVVRSSPKRKRAAPPERGPSIDSYEAEPPPPAQDSGPSVDSLMADPIPAPARAAAPAPGMAAPMPRPGPAPEPPPDLSPPPTIAPAPPPPGFASPPEPPRPPEGPPPPPAPAQPGLPPPPPPSPLDAWTGTFREVMELLLAGRTTEGLDRALSWLRDSPGDVLALVALGEAAERMGNTALAARAYGAIVDLFPSRADLRRFAGERLSRVRGEQALSLAIDTFRKALESRPDHPSSHRLLAMALLRAGKAAEAFDLLGAARRRTFDAKFPGIPRILADDHALAGQVLMTADPSRRREVMDELFNTGAGWQDTPSVRFVLVWETDANDVDFHIHDGVGGHAYFREKALASGGELYADVTQGYGPECFSVPRPPEKRAYPYKLQAHYYRQGPMGFGMGSLQIIEHDGDGDIVFEERPYVVMVDQAYVDLGMVIGPLQAPPQTPPDAPR